jgi:hypothetical protein
MTLRRSSAAPCCAVDGRFGDVMSAQLGHGVETQLHELNKRPMEHCARSAGVMHRPLPVRSRPGGDASRVVDVEIAGPSRPPSVYKHLSGRRRSLALSRDWSVDRRLRVDFIRSTRRCIECTRVPVPCMAIECGTGIGPLTALTDISTRPFRWLCHCNDRCVAASRTDAAGP